MRKSLEPIDASTGRSINPMDRTPRLWVRFPVGEACHKHPGQDLVLTAEPIKSGSMLCTKCTVQKKPGVGRSSSWGTKNSWKKPWIRIQIGPKFWIRNQI